MFHFLNIITKNVNYAKSIILSQSSREVVTAWKVSKCGVFSGPYFPVFGPKKSPYLDTFHAVFHMSNYRNGKL